MTDYELARRFKMGDSVATIAGIDGDDCDVIEKRLRALMVGTDIALSIIANEKNTNE